MNPLLVDSVLGGIIVGCAAGFVLIIMLGVAAFVLRLAADAVGGWWGRRRARR